MELFQYYSAKRPSRQTRLAGAREIQLTVAGRRDIVAGAQATPPAILTPTHHRRGVVTTNDYHFVTHWRMRSTCEEITEILHDAPGLTRWWPSVYLDVQMLEAGDERGIGRVVGLYTKGWLPYTLHWRLRITDNHNPYGFGFDAEGDFAGRGEWRFSQDGEWTAISYDWRVLAEKPLLRYFSFILKPIFSRNHHWAMRQGEKSLELELRRRHARTAAERAAVPPPPPTTFAWLLPRLRAGKSLPSRSRL